MATEYIALIPAYEPDRKMLSVIKDLRKFGFDIIVVDDGSGEDYMELFMEAADDATVLTHKTNKGKGAALRTGFAHINRYKIPAGCEARDVVVVTVDADGQHLAKDAFRIAAYAASRPGTLVLGSRGLREDVPLRSKFGNTVTRHVYKAATGLRIHDTQTGLRAFTADMLPVLMTIRGDRYEYEINVLLEVSDRKIPVIEEEIETVYMDGNSSSHFSTIKDSFRIYKEILRFSASSFISFLVDYGMYALILAIAGRAGAAYSLVIANVGARIVSSTVNYTINRKLVFRSNAGLAKSASGYFTLAALILAANTAILSVLTGTLGIGSMAAKVITEIILFSVSWLVQRYVIFYKAEEKTENERKACKISGSAARPAKLRARKPGLKAAYISPREEGSEGGTE